MKAVKVRLSKLVVNKELTKLRKVNDFFVSRYRQAYRSGSIFPPLLVNSKTMDIVSGNHRYKAMTLEFDENHEVDVFLKSYSNEREMLEDFIKENLTHGNAMDTFTQKKMASELINKYEATIEEVADLFLTSLKKVTKWGEEFVSVGRKGESKVVKKGPHIKSGKMTKKQHKEHIEKDRGFISPIAITTQLTRWIKNDWIDIDNGKHVEALQILFDVLGGFLLPLEDGKEVPNR